LRPEQPMTSVQALPPHLETRMIALFVGGRVVRADLLHVCERLSAMLKESNAELVVCDVGALVEYDIGTLDALARVALTARQAGRRLRLLNASSRLHELLDFAGLNEVMEPGGSGVEPSREPKERKEAGGVEEEDDPRDPPL
jgi:ABC-type transporter Mla MlaB component